MPLDLKKTITTTQQWILGKNPARIYGLFVNDGANVIYLGLGKEAEVNRGIRLNALGGNYEITLTNPFYGEVYAVSSIGDSTLLVTEI